MQQKAHRYLVATVAALIVLAAVAGCAGTAPSAPATPAQPGATAPAAMKVGTLATQDVLPLWVAADKGYATAEGLPSFEVVTFQSAQEEQAAFTAGAVDALMTDLIVSAKLRASGTKVVVSTIMLGATTAQGRFAVVGAPKTAFKSMAGLRGVPVGIGSGTITEYVLDELMAEAGVAAADVKTEEVPKMPIRFQLLMSGQLKAASLPEPFVSLALQQGAYVVPGGDDTKAEENVSQSVLCVSEEYASSPAGAAALAGVLKAWNKAVGDVNADPAAFRATLVAKANLPQPLAATYQVSDYPTAAPPTTDEIQRVLDWMQGKGYLISAVTPEELLTGK
jgi:NitT/TauT family transport system substrate-binding protein